MSEAAAESVMSASEYSESVYTWLQQAYQWHTVALSFPSYLAYQASLQNVSGQHSRLQPQTTSTTSTTRTSENARRNEDRDTEIFRGHQANNDNADEQTPQWVEYAIPPLWKRFAAEFIDFLILFVLKIVVTFVAVDWFALIDLDRYDTTFLAAATGQDLDLETALEFTSDLVFLELVHRMVVCIFEALCTHKGAAGRPGGATPGKLIMGLRIFLCDQVVMTADPDRVQITPALDLGPWWALIRSVLKNMSMAFFFPVCFTFFFLPFNRTVYDVMSRTIVVEVPRQNQQQRQPQQN